MPDNTNDIDALLSLLERGGWERYRATAAALVAERDALREQLRLANIDQCNTEAEANDRDRDLRERLVCAALTAMVMAEASYVDAAEGAVCYADAAIAAMRKGEA